MQQQGQLTEKANVCVSYRDLEPLKIPRSLKEQEQLTRTLEKAVPLFEETTPEGILDHLSDVAPVRMTGYGPTFEEKYGNRPTNAGVAPVIPERSR